MDPNQQPNQLPPQPVPQPQPTPLPPQPGYAAQPQVQQPAQQPVQPTYPAPPSEYQAPTSPQAYDPNYLDSIAPPPPRSNFLSGSFGKIFFVLIGLFVLGVSLIIAFSGKDKTADLQQISVRLDNFTKTVKKVQPSLRSTNLSNTNTNFTIWLTGNQSQAEQFLKDEGVKKAAYDKKMVSSEKKLTDQLDAKFENARLSATLNRVYASSMAAETQKIINLLNAMAKKSKSTKIRAYAKEASSNLQPLQKSFAEFNDDGN